MKKLILLILALLLLTNLTFAENREIITEGTYIMGDGETPLVAEERALLQAKRTALEQAGTYVESYSETKNMQLTKDEVNVLAAGVMEVTVLEKNRTLQNDGMRFWVKIRANVKTDDIDRLADKAKDKQVVADYQKIQQDYANSQAEIVSLKNQLAAAKDGAQQQAVQTMIGENERKLQAGILYDKGLALYLEHDYYGAIRLLNKAIALYPKNHWNYDLRARCYVRLSLFNKALQDYQEAFDTLMKYEDPTSLDYELGGRLYLGELQKLYYKEYAKLL